MIQERRNYQPLVTRPEQRASISLCDSCLVAVVQFIGARCDSCRRRRRVFRAKIGWACWALIAIAFPFLIWQLISK